MERRESLRRILGEVSIAKKRLGTAFVLSIFSSGIMMTIPYFTGFVIDHAVEGSISIENIAFYGTTLFLTQGLANWFRVFLTNTSGNLVIRDLRERIFQKIMSNDIAFFDKNQSGEIVSRLTSDCQVVGGAATTNLNDGFRAVIQFAISTGMIFYIAPPELIAVSIGGIISIMLVSRVGGQLIRGYSREQQRWTAEASKFSQERIQSIRTVRAFGHEEKEVALYCDLVRRVQTQTGLEARANATLWAMNPFMGNMLLVYILYSTVPYLQSGVISSGDVTALLLYGTFSGMALGMFGTFYTNMNKAAGAGRRLWNILDEPAQPIGGSKVLQSLQGDVVFDSVNFCYPSRPDELIFKNLSLRIRANETTALVGHSGSGKSTIPKLLFQFYQPDSGRILLDGENLSEMNYDWLRKNVAMVPQDPELFSNTIRYNIEYGASGKVTETDIRDAASRANAIEFIDKFDNGLDTEIGESGVLLSGGQRQRIVIARALLRRPKILVLDEATSALDAESESLVQSAIENLAEEDLTLIVIAHRLSTIKNAQRVVLINDGKVNESGTFAELVEQGGTFANFVHRQQIS